MSVSHRRKKVYNGPDFLWLECKPDDGDAGIVHVAPDEKGFVLGYEDKNGNAVVAMVTWYDLNALLAVVNKQILDIPADGSSDLKEE